MSSRFWRPRLAFVVALALVMVTSMWGPIAPEAGASQVDDLGTDDPQDVEGVDEPPWRAWETKDLQFALSDRTDIALGSDDEAYLTWDSKDDVRLAYPIDDPRPGARFGSVAVNVNASPEPGGVAVQEDGRIWVAYQAQGIVNGHDELYAATTTDPDEGEWTRWRLADIGSLARVAIDKAGTVHVVYQDEDITLRHATFTPEVGWQQENITEVQPSGTRDLDLAIKAGRIHVVWDERIFENSDPREGYAVKTLDTGEGWTVEAIPYIPAFCGFKPDVGAAPDGAAWIACRGDGGITAWHRAVNGTWSQEQVADGSELIPPRHNHDLAGETSLAVDEEGVSHVVFRTRAPIFFKNDVLHPGQPQYAARVDGEWTVETIDRTAQDNGRHPSLALDSEGRPHVAYVMWTRIDPSPGHPCPGCDLVNDRLSLQYARPLAATVDGEMP